MDDPVELKVTLSGDVSPTVSRLRLRHARHRKIWFLKDLAERSSGVDLPLLAAGVIVHLRSRDDESTVKLRPCRRERLVGEWTGSHCKGKGRDGYEFRIEWEWAGSTVSYLHPPSRGSTMTSFSVASGAAAPQKP